MTKEPDQLTVEAMAGNRTHEAAVSRRVPVCSRKPWTGGSEEDIGNKGKGRKEGGKREIDRKIFRTYDMYCVGMGWIGEVCP